MEDKNPVVDNETVKVMLADHDKADQENFQEALVKAHINAEVTIVKNGKELMDNLEDITLPNPDIIFLDLDMPIKDGKECLKEIQNNDDLKDIPTIIYTVSNKVKDIEDTFKSGANLYLPKPVFFRNLVRLIRKIFTVSWNAILLKPLWKNFIMSEESVCDKPLIKSTVTGELIQETLTLAPKTEKAA